MASSCSNSGNSHAGRGRPSPSSIRVWHAIDSFPISFPAATTCSTVTAETNSEGSTFSGIAPDATILSIRQSSNKFRAADDPSGSGFGDVETLAKAMRTAADSGATVINVSSVACRPTDGGLDDQPLGAALAYA